MTYQQFCKSSLIQILRLGGKSRKIKKLHFIKLRNESTRDLYVGDNTFYVERPIIVVDLPLPLMCEANLFLSPADNSIKSRLLHGIN